MLRPTGTLGLLRVMAAALLVACGPGVTEDDALADGSGGAAGSDGATGENDDATGGGAGGADSTGAVDPSGGEDPTTGDETETTGDPAALPEGCQCAIPDDRFSCDDLATTECDGEVLCPTVTRDCARPPDFYACDTEYEYDEDALECALTALRDRTIGKVEIAAENEVCGFEGCGTDRWRIAIRGEDVAVVDDCSASPLGAEASYATLRQMAPSAFFEACLSMPSAAMRYDCMFDGLTDDLGVCAPD